jgi:predicted aspartyl protease
MGRVTTPATLQNLEDFMAIERGTLTPDKARTVDVPDALVDTGAMMLAAPPNLIAQLGLLPARTRTMRTANGVVTAQIYHAVRLTVMGRDCTCDVMEVPDGCPVLIGQVPLELLDWVVDPVNQRLIGNPEHGGQHMVDMF